MYTESALLLTAAIIPGTICLIGALILAERFCRNRPRDAPAAAPTVIINQQINPQNPNNDIPLQPYPNPIHAPIP